MSWETIAVLDFGSQYTQLIARRIREQNVHSIIYPADITVEELSRSDVKGIVLSGGPASVYNKGALRCDVKTFELGVPILGICYGMQLGCQILGAEITTTEKREYGRRNLSIIEADELFANVPVSTIVWASHGDQINELGDDFAVLATTATCPFAAVKHKRKEFYGVQFHPEVSHTPNGIQGLAVRIIGEVTPHRLEILRAADEILLDEIISSGFYKKVAQALSVLLPVSTVGVMGDDRSYENVIAIRVVETHDFMTADFSQIPYEILGMISNRIINEVKGMNRVVYDISSKPPATIEWE